MLLNVLGCQLTNHFQGQDETMAQYSFTSTETRRLVRRNKGFKVQGFIELFAPGG